jgi:hypothetical protein
MSALPEFVLELPTRSPENPKVDFAALFANIPDPPQDHTWNFTYTGENDILVEHRMTLTTTDTNITTPMITICIVSMR